MSCAARFRWHDAITACSNEGWLRIVRDFSGVGVSGRGGICDIEELDLPPPSAVAFSRVGLVGLAPPVTRVAPLFSHFGLV